MLHSPFLPPSGASWRAWAIKRQIWGTPWSVLSAVPAARSQVTITFPKAIQAGRNAMESKAGVLLCSTGCTSGCTGILTDLEGLGNLIVQMTNPFSRGRLLFTLLLFLSSCGCNNHITLGIIMFWKEIAGCGFSLNSGLGHRVSVSSRSANDLKVPKDSKRRKLSSLKIVITPILKIFPQNAV